MVDMLKMSMNVTWQFVVVAVMAMQNSAIVMRRMKPHSLEFKPFQGENVFLLA